MNHLVVCGLNYHSTPIAIRERFTIPESCLAHALHGLARMPHVKEAVVLSTCNRTEVYAAVTDVRAGLQEIETFFLSTRAVADHDALKPNFKLLREDAALHLFRVASGLDSMVLGEGQIMSQVKAAHQAALEAGTAGPLLDQVFKLALTCGKRVRSETSMGRRAVSISSAAVELARSTCGPLKNRNILVIGAGRMAQICIKHLLNESGSGKIILINRSDERVNKFLENKLNNGERLQPGLHFDDRHELAAAADLVLVATSAPHFILDQEQLKQKMAGRNVCVIDISVPRNVDPAVAEIPGVRLFNTDDLSTIVNKNLAEREMLVGEAEELIFESLEAFDAWQRALLVVPTIAGLREKIEAIRQEQMEKSNSGEQLEEISRAIVNQILHHPTVQLKATRDYGILKQQAEALRTLFNLETSNTKAAIKARPKCQKPAT
jgi:glutamyl-tRNA reductase